MSMRLFRSTTLDSNANTYVGDQLSLFVGDDYILRISDNTTPGGVTVKGGGSSGSGSFVRSDIIATNGQTVFDATYAIGYVDVYYNGVLLPVSRYSASNGFSITLNNPAIGGDTVSIIAWSISNVAVNTGDITFGANGNPNGISSSDNDADIIINAPGSGGVVDIWSGDYNGPYGGEVYMDNTGVYVFTNNEANQWQFDNNGNITLPAGGTINFANGSNALVGGSGTTGPTGPQGPTGTGSTGPTGNQGPTGPAGSGNGNVSTGDITFTGNVIGSTNGNIVIGTALVPSGNATIDLGTIDHQWRSLYVSGNTIYLGGVPLSTSGNSLIVNGSAVATTGNITFADTTLGTVNAGSNVNINTVYEQVNNNQAVYMDFNASGGTEWVSMSPGIQLNDSAFSIQFWIYRRNLFGHAFDPILSFLASGTASPFLYFNDSNQLIFDPYYMTLPVTMQNNTWYHVAVARDASGNLNAWLDGTQITGGTIASAVLTDQAVGPMTEIGYLWYGPSYLNAALSSLQIVVGNNVYDPTQSTITVPTLVPADVTGTQLLISTSYQTDHAFDDASGTQTITNNNSTPAYGGAPPYNVTVTSNNLTWQFMPGAEGNPQLLVPNAAAIISQSSLAINADGGEGQFTANGVYISSSSQGYVYINVQNATSINGDPQSGSAVSIGAGAGVDGGEGGPIITYAAAGSGNTITHAGGEGGSLYMYGGEGALTLDGSSTAAIGNLSISDSNVIVGIANHQLVNHDVLWLHNISTTTQLNAQTFRVSVIDSNNVQLFFDPALTQPVTGNSYGGLTPYDYGGGSGRHSTTGGNIYLFGGSPSNLNYGAEGAVVFGANLVPYSSRPLTIENNYNYWQFDSNGDTTLPTGGSIADTTGNLRLPDNGSLISHHNLYLSTDSGMLGLYGTEGINLTASSVGYINFDVNQAPSGLGAYNGGFITTNAGYGADGGEGGYIALFAGDGSGNTITQTGGEGGGLWMFGGGGQTYVDSAAISNIALGTPTVITVPGNSVHNGDKIYINNVRGTTQLNYHSYYVHNLGGDQLALYQDQWLQLPVTAAGLSPYALGNITALSTTITDSTGISNPQGLLDLAPGSNVLINNILPGATVTSSNIYAQNGGIAFADTVIAAVVPIGGTATDYYVELEAYQGGCLVFNGPGSQQWIQASPGTQFALNTWTVSVWFKLFSYGGTILASSTNGLYINIVNNTTINVGYQQDGFNGTSFTVPAMGLGTWTWLAVNSDANGLTVWTNGVQSSTGLASPATFGGVTDQIGTWTGDASYFHGLLQGMVWTESYAVYDSTATNIPVPTVYADINSISSAQLIMNAFNGSPFFDATVTQTLTEFNGVAWTADSPVQAWGNSTWLFNDPPSGNIWASTAGGSVNIYGGSPSQYSYGSEGSVIMGTPLLVSSLSPYNSDLLSVNVKNSSYTFSTQAQLSGPTLPVYTPYNNTASSGSINWSSSSPFSSMVTSNGSINLVVNQHLSINPPLPVIGLGAYTISLWFYPTITAGSNTVLGSSNGGLTLLSQNWTDLIITTGNPDTATGFSFPGTLSLNTWYYLVVTRDQEQRCAAWLNGELLQGGAGYNSGVDVNNYTQPIAYVGAGVYGGVFQGQIADVKIDNVNLYSTWGPGLNGNIPVPTAPAVPGSSTQVLFSATDSANVFVNSANAIIYTPFALANQGTELGIHSDGSISFPGTRFGNISVSGTATTVGGLYPAFNLPGQSNNFIWQASSPDVTGFTMTVRAQHNDPSTCTEMATITAAQDSTGNLLYSINNRLKSNATASDTTLGVLLASDITASGNVMTVNAAVGSDTVYFTYEVTEFMTSHAT